MVEIIRVCIQKGDTTIRTYEPGDEFKALRLFQEVFGKEKTLAHWNWEFRERSEIPYVMLGFHGDQLAAHCAAIPLRVTYGRETLLMLQGVDFMSDPRYRSHRIFLKTAAAFFDTFGGSDNGRAPLIMGFPGTRHRLLGEKRLNYTTLTAVHCLQKKVQKAAPLGLLPRLRGTVETVSRFDTRADALWAHQRKAYPMAVVRDASYLNWRYASHPTHSYTLLQVVTRRRRTLGAWAVLNVRQDPGLLVDFFPSLDGEWMNRLLLREVEHWFLQAGVETMECWCHPASPIYPILRREGWEVVPQRDDLHLGAIRFDPKIRLDWMRDHFCYMLGDTDIA